MAILPQLQTNNRTFVGRHWHEHSVLSRLFNSHRKLKVLSFGCSTGEELLSIRALMPNAELLGCDVDWASVQRARALLDDRATIFMSDDRSITEHGPYDAIVCNSVLLAPTQVIGGTRRGIDPGLWQDVVSLLHASLEPGGVLQIINSNIPARLHPELRDYAPLHTPLIYGPNFVDQFDLESKLLCSGVGGVGWSSPIPRHLGEEHWHLLTIDDLETLHWRKPGTSGAEMSAPADEAMPNLNRNGEWAKGSTSYRPILDPAEKRPSSHIEVDAEWKAVAVDSVQIIRKHRRIWFDGQPAYERTVVVDLEGASATVFIEAAMGRRSTHLASKALFGAEPIRSPSF